MLCTGVAVAAIPLAIQAAETLGPTYPIAEPDLLEEIQAHLQAKQRSGELARLQREAIARANRSAVSPRPVEGLMRTERARTFYFDPTIVANRTITGPDGRVVVAQGQRLNPLDQVDLPQWLIFFDARDALQVRKAAELLAKAEGRAKPILTGGSYIDMQKKWGRPVYFDQAGLLTRKLGIQQVPAMVTQEGKRLRIDEVPV